jgi:uncharacterized repeat protein (TIGR03803 family)
MARIATTGFTILALSLSLCPAVLAQPAFTSLFSFPGADGAFTPRGSLVTDANGVLYGTTTYGGDHGFGAVFALATPQSPRDPWTESLIWSFAGGTGDGAYPFLTGMVIGPGSVLYGTTTSGGQSGLGTVFSLTPPAAPGGQWIENVLHSFAGGTDGATPQGSPVIDHRGVIFGTTVKGGSANQGTVFSLAPPASPGGAWNERILYRFPGGKRGGNPQAGVVIGTGGVLYGTTSGGGSVFSLAPPATHGGVWTETVLHAGGGSPTWLVIEDRGVLYGSTRYKAGTIFSLAPPSAPGGAWTWTTLYKFGSAGTLGVRPTGLALNTKTGALYGTTQYSTMSPAGHKNGAGIVFELHPPASGGRAWTFRLLHAFHNSDGANPLGPLTLDGQGETLYGTTSNGGIADLGTVYSMTP